MKRKKPGAKTAMKMAPPRSPAVQPAHEALPLHHTQPRMSRQTLFKVGTTERLQCLSECFMELCHRNSLLDIELKRLEEKHDASREGPSLAATGAQCGSAMAVHDTNQNPCSFPDEHVKPDSIQQLLVQESKRREDEQSEKQRDAILALISLSMQLKNRIEAARNGLAEDDD